MNQKKKETIIDVNARRTYIIRTGVAPLKRIIETVIKDR